MSARRILAWGSQTAWAVKPEYALAINAGSFLLFLASFKIRRWNQLPAYLWALWFLVSVASKLVIEHDWMTSAMKMDPRDWTWTAASGCTAIALTILATGRFQFWGLWALNAAVSLLFWIDLLYYRYFDDLPGIYVLSSLSEAPAASPSAWALRRSSDLLLFVDLLPPLLWWLVASAEARARLLIERSLAIQWLVALAVYHGVSLYRLDDSETRLFRLRFRNMAIMEEVGLFNYHIYDVLQLAQSRWNNLVDRSYDKELLARLVGESRASLSEPVETFGRCRGKNLLVIQLESLESFVLDLKVEGQEVTPFFNQLKNECLVGSMQDQTGQGRSSDGEFIYNNALLPPGERPLVYAYPSNHYFGIPAVLNEKGYYTLYSVPYWGSFWNCRFMSEQYGFRHHMLRDDFRAAEPGEQIGWGLSDKAIFVRVVPKLVRLPRPFYCYAVTMMSHHPYQEIEDEDALLHLSPRFAKTMLKDYLYCCRLRDEQMREVVDYLKVSGIWDSTVVVFVGDHDARIPNEEMALLRQDGRYDKIDKLLNDRVFLMIHCPGDEPRGPLPKDAVQDDMIPTLLHLLGVDDVPTCFFGRNLLSPKRAKRPMISKGGYALDEQFAVTSEGTDFTAYRLSDHSELEGSEPCPLRDEMRRYYKFVYDFLRLDLVPTGRALKFP